VKLTVTEAARMEMIEARDFYRSRDRRLAPALTSEIRLGLRRILQQPSPWHPLNYGLRRYRTERFPYGLIYKLREDEILIVAFDHLHPEPEYWIDRIEEAYLYPYWNLTGSQMAQTTAV
jgi:hypothetical protein